MKPITTLKLDAIEVVELEATIQKRIRIGDEVERIRILMNILDRLRKEAK